MTVRSTRRWQGVTGLTFAAAGVGVVLNRPGALLLGVVGAAFAAYSQFASPPEPVLDVTRTLSDPEPDPGDEVTVTLQITNQGGFLPDLRLADGVPPALEVVDGSPRFATALRAGATATLSYTVEVSRGTYDFEEVTVVARDPSSAQERETTAYDETTIRCVPRLTAFRSFPVRQQTESQVGRVATTQGGSGVEFHGTREYRSGDPISRVNWRRLARTGDLTTVEFREERAASIVIVVDARESAYVADPDGDTAVDHSVGAAGGIAATLLDAGDRVGVASLGPEWTWLAPGLGRDHRERLRRTLALDDGFSPTPSGRRFLPTVVFRRLRKHLDPDAQIVFCTPLMDNYAEFCARRFEAHGHRVTVVSPDVTVGDTLGTTVEGIERDVRVRKLRRRGIRVIDWDVETSFPVAVANSEKRWSR